jgi:HPt (histidine-containing phosphotransfer) domain-containing protein
MISLNPQKIQDLGRDLSPRIAIRFLSDFLGMLPQRLERIQSAVADHDDETAMDAVLSLTITAAMTGAMDTESCCLTLQASIRNLDFNLANDQVANLAELVGRLQRAAPELLDHAKRALGVDEDFASACAAA